MEDLYLKIGMASLSLVSTVIGGLILFFVKGHFESAKAKQAEHDKAIADLEKNHAKFATAVEDLKAIKESVGGASASLREKMHELELSNTRTIGELKAQLQLSQSTMASANVEMSKLQGRVDEHMHLISSFTSEMRSLNDKLAALFRVIDAPKRASDGADKG